MSFVGLCEPSCSFLPGTMERYCGIQASVYSPFPSIVTLHNNIQLPLDEFFAAGCGISKQATTKETAAITQSSSRWRVTAKHKRALHSARAASLLRELAGQSLSAPLLIFVPLDPGPQEGRTKNSEKFVVKNGNGP